MDNETKEPNDEQMHGASYEQTPDIEGKQLSDGADDAPPLKIGHQMKMTSHAKKKGATHF